MKQSISIEIESLITGIENPKVPIEQGLFLESIERYEGGEPFNRLARVTFSGANVNQIFAGSPPFTETLLLGRSDCENSILHLYARGTGTACKIATARLPEKTIIIADEYKDAILMNKLSKMLINHVFDLVRLQPELIEPKPRTVWDEDEF